MLKHLLRFSTMILLSVTSYACYPANYLITQAEGYQPCTYLDSRNIPTICYGYNLLVDQGQLASTGCKANRNGGCCTQSQCNQLLYPAIANAQQGAYRIYGSICPCIDAVLTDMVYNLGEGGLRSFTTFNSLIKSHQWSAAANDLQTGTIWCGQVKNRCYRNMQIIAQGC